ncbi:hypothetical protein [Halorussus lipolyticus]|uniref:hypothetical protein n=1 Tax=Halorussus lipolyticus TaxID=3034024 RepID=UPI0023E8D0B1|nr:hypothetical protein [Halorussus sp. DT80]
MPSSAKSVLVTAVRVVFVGLGVGIAALTALELASMPPPPPESDGFAHGMAGLFGGLIILVTLGLAAVGVSLPALLGFDDPLGFDYRQRLVLKVSGVLVVGGLVAGLTYVLLAGFRYGVLVWFGLVVLASLAACATLVWRLGEALVVLVSRLGSAGLRALR